MRGYVYYDTVVRNLQDLIRRNEFSGAYLAQKLDEMVADFGKSKDALAEYGATIQELKWTIEQQSRAEDKAAEKAAKLEQEKRLATAEARRQQKAAASLRAKAPTGTPKWMKALVGAIKQRLDLDRDELRSELLAEIEKQMPKYRGVWQVAETYHKGNFVTFDGSMWAAIVDDPGKPGTEGWQMCCRKGRDADRRNHAQ